MNFGVRGKSSLDEKGLNIDLEKHQNLKPISPCGLVLTGMGFMLVLNHGTAAYAQAASAAQPAPLNSGGSAVQGGGAASGTTTPSVPTPATNQVPQDPYYNYRIKGLNINLPPPSNTVDQGLFGFRKKLADDYGIGYVGFTLATGYDNLLRHAHSTNRVQQYLGQRLTGSLANNLFVTVDLSRYGIPDGQIVVGGVEGTYSWNPAGPTAFGFNNLSYYQTLLNKRVEVKVGLFSQANEFVGPLTAGSLNAGTFGTSASLLAEGGTSNFSYPTYGINLTFHATDFWYDKIGVSRAINPDGTLAEHNYNRIGVNFRTPNSGLFLDNEVGYLKPSASDQLKTWVRFGGILSKSRYVEIERPRLRGTDNYVYYFLVDQQLSQISSTLSEAYRGLYAGFTVEYAPPYYNRFSEYYEARLYGLGLIPGRPRDQVSLLATHQVFSKQAVAVAQRARSLTHDSTEAVTLSYSANLIHGIYLNGGLQYINNPTPVTYRSNTGSALNAILGMTFYW